MEVPKPQEVSKEFAWAIIWVVKNRRRAAWRLGGESIIVSPKGVVMTANKQPGAAKDSGE